MIGSLEGFVPHLKELKFENMAKSAEGFGIFHKIFWAFGMGSCHGKSIKLAIVSGAYQAFAIKQSPCS